MHGASALIRCRSFCIAYRNFTAKGRTRDIGWGILASGGDTMAKFAIWAELESKPGKEKEVEEFLKSAQPLAEKENETLTWYALKIGPSRFGIFDTFAEEKGREAHLSGEIAKALMAK